jgi:hypothetical protein
MSGYGKIHRSFLLKIGGREPGRRERSFAGFTEVASDPLRVICSPILSFSDNETGSRTRAMGREALLAVFKAAIGG